jgi:hypothetical protein
MYGCTPNTNSHAIPPAGAGQLAGGYGSGAPAPSSAPPRANAKPGDWLCSGCGNNNFAWRSNCNRCSKEKDPGDAPVPLGSDGGRGGFGGGRGGGGGGPPRREGDWDCPACGNNNFSFRDACKKCGAVKGMGGMGGSGGGGSYAREPPAYVREPPTYGAGAAYGAGPAQVAAAPEPAAPPPSKPKVTAAPQGPLGECCSKHARWHADVLSDSVSRPVLSLSVGSRSCAWGHHQARPHVSRPAF